jgi:hypothetical protein
MLQNQILTSSLLNALSLSCLVSSTNVSTIDEL